MAGADPLGQEVLPGPVTGWNRNPAGTGSTGSTGSRELMTPPCCLSMGRPPPRVTFAGGRVSG
jgi:hypothetical protein